MHHNPQDPEDLRMAKVIKFPLARRWQQMSEEPETNDLDAAIIRHPAGKGRK